MRARSCWFCCGRRGAALSALGVVLCASRFRSEELPSGNALRSSRRDSTRPEVDISPPPIDPADPTQAPLFLGEMARYRETAPHWQERKWLGENGLTPAALHGSWVAQREGGLAPYLMQITCDGKGVLVELTGGTSRRWLLVGVTSYATQGGTRDSGSVRFDWLHDSDGAIPLWLYDRHITITAPAATGAEEGELPVQFALPYGVVELTFRRVSSLP